MGKPSFKDLPLIDYRTLEGYERYLPTAFDDTLSMLEKINKVIHELNKIGFVVNDFIEMWNALVEWITGEGMEQIIEDKLIEWKNDGTLDKIINQTIFGEIQAKLVELGDDIIALAEKQGADVTRLEGLINRRVDLSRYYKNLTTYNFYDSVSNSPVIVTKIPKNDENGNFIPLKHGLSYDKIMPEKLETARQFANRKSATFVSNASTFSSNTNLNVGIIIKDGVLLQNNKREVYNWTLAFKKDNSMTAFPSEIDGQEILRQGYWNALTAFIPVIRGGQVVSTTILESRDGFKGRHPRQWIGQDSKGDIYFFSCEGRSFQYLGMTMADTARWTKENFPDIVFAYNLDGGGSSGQIYYGTNLLPQYDGRSTAGRTVERPSANFLYVGKDREVENDAGAMFSVIGEGIKSVSDRLARAGNRLSFIPQNRIDLPPFLLNGSQAVGTTGGLVPRVYKLGNNSLHFVGAVNIADPSLPFVRLPAEIRPNFTTHHIVPGNARGEIYKIIIRSDGEMQCYPWSGEEGSGNMNYVRLDGISVAIGPSYAIADDGYEIES